MPKETVFNPYHENSIKLVGRILEHPVRGVGLITGYIDRSDSDDGRAKFTVLWSGDTGTESVPDRVVLESRIPSGQGDDKSPFCGS